MLGFVAVGLIGTSRRGNVSRCRRSLSADRTRHGNFEELSAAIQALSGDPLETDGGNIVHFRGSQDAELMIIGEGPGAQEDLERLPFVGRSGKLLDKILRSVEIDPEKDVYITNAVKRRPKNNRDPSRQEIDWYLPFLEEEVRLVDPSVIILSGRIALTAILPDVDSRITRVRGQWFERWGKNVMPVFHPSYLLRNPAWKEGSPKALMWQDMCQIKRRLDELSLPTREGDEDT